MSTSTLEQDTQGQLTEQGFSCGNTWYHGTSSALADTIKQDGLKRSGDPQLNEATKKTMATIGNKYTATVEPVFLTQNKALAHYWAEQKVRERSVRIEGNEQAVVFSITLPESINKQVKPDVGAASLLLVKEGENFMAYVAGLYQEKGLAAPDINLRSADRLEYLNKLGMAYIDNDIAVDYLTLLEN